MMSGRMTSGARGMGWAVALCCALWLDACSQSTLARLGLARQPAGVHQSAPAQPAPAAASAAPDDREPVPAAAPRVPVETERVAPPPGVRSEQRS
jgi:hypothetical protein